MKHYILTLLVILTPNLFAVTLPSNPAAMVPIISYLLSDTTPIVTPNTGTLDTSFDADGIVISDNPTNQIVNEASIGLYNEVGNDIAIDTAGNIYVVGKTREVDAPVGWPATQYDKMAVWKYNSDGVVDTNFGSHNGVAVYNFNVHPEVSEGYALVLDTSGNIYVTGTVRESQNGAAYMAIWKFDNTGNPVTTFANNGVNIPDETNTSITSSQGFDITLDNADNIIVTGDIIISNVPGIYMALRKFDNNGSLYNTFGTNGIVTSARGVPDYGYNDRGNGVTVDSENNIYVAGWTRNAATPSITMNTIWKYDSSGNAVNSFDDDGIAILDMNSTYANSVDIVLDDSSNIYVAVQSNFSGGNILLAKYDNNANPDINFGTDGIVISDIGLNVEQGNSILLDKENNIFVCGVADTDVSTDYEMVIWKYDTTGTLDPTFDFDGIVTHGEAAGGGTPKFDMGYAMVLDESGNIFITGYSYNNDNNWDMVIWKYK